MISYYLKYIWTRVKKVDVHLVWTWVKKADKDPFRILSQKDRLSSVWTRIKKADVGLVWTRVRKADMGPLYTRVCKYSHGRRHFLWAVVLPVRKECCSQYILSRTNRLGITKSKYIEQKTMQEKLKVIFTLLGYNIMITYEYQYLCCFLLKSVNFRNFNDIYSIQISTCLLKTYIIIITSE